jgi:hypothetical protein
MSKVKLTCVERTSVAGVVYVPGEIETDAETAELMLKARPHAFKKAGGQVDSSPREESDRGDGSDAEPAPEKRRKKPARVRRKE